MQKIIVYTDGGARGNPGPAGSGAYITDASGTVIAEVSKFLGTRNNNFAEYEAVALAFAEIKKKFGTRTKELEVVVYLDSQLVARQLSDEYQIKEETLFSQYIKVHNFLGKDFPNVSFIHIPRGQNKQADRLANEAMDRGA